MVSLGKQGKIYGAQIGARAFEKVMEIYVDPMVPIPIGAGTPAAKLSTWVNLVGGIAAPMVARKTGWVSEDTAMVFGGHLFSNIVDYGLQFAGVAGASVPQSFRPTLISTPQAYPTYQMAQPTYYNQTAGITDVAVKNPIQNGGRYARI